MNISEPAAKEVKDALEKVLIKKLKAASVLGDFKEKATEYDRIENQYYKSFSITCYHLEVQLETFETLKQQAAE